MLLLCSCVETSENEIAESLSDKEMKSKVEVEEIVFEKDSLEIKDEAKPEGIIPIDPSLGGCVLPKNGLTEDSLLPPPFTPLIGCGPPSPNSRVFDIPEIEPQFPGGVVELKKFIQENIRYPEGDVSVQGRVYVSFVIEKDGCVTHVKIMRGVSEKMDQEALRLVSSMPKWIPGQNNGKVVAAKVRLPIRFSLN